MFDYDILIRIWFVIFHWNRSYATTNASLENWKKKLKNKKILVEIKGDGHKWAFKGCTGFLEIVFFSSSFNRQLILGPSFYSLHTVDSFGLPPKLRGLLYLICTPYNNLFATLLQMKSKSKVWPHSVQPPAKKVSYGRARVKTWIGGRRKSECWEKREQQGMGL